MTENIYKEKFEFIKNFCDNYSYLMGWGLIEKQEDGRYAFVGFDGDSYIVWAGRHDEELIIQEFTERENEVTEDGFYEFRALLILSKAQIGDYPPPNIEMPEYMMVEYIEFEKKEN